MKQLDRLFHWYQVWSDYLFLPMTDSKREEDKRRIRMLILLSGFYFLLICLAGLRFLSSGGLPAPVKVHFVLNAIILMLIYTRHIQVAIRFLSISYVLSHFLLLFVSDLTNLLYVLTTFVAVSVLLKRQWRLPYGLATIVLIVVAGYMTSDNPVYASVTHSNVVLFTLLGVISILISTSVIEGDREQIKTQLQGLQEKEMLYRVLAENISDMVTLHAPDGKFVYVSPSYIRVTGYSEAELLKLSAQDLVSLVHPENVNQIYADAHRQLSKEDRDSKLIYRHRKKDGTYCWFETCVTSIYDANGKTVQYLASSRDITQQKYLQESLRLSNEKLKEAQSVAQIGSWHWDIASNKISWSDELYRIFGVDEIDFQGTYEDYLKYVFEDDRDYLFKTIENAYRTHQPYSVYHRIMHPQLGERIIYGLGRVFADEQGRVCYMHGTAQDVTELKQVEKALRQSEERAQALLKAIPDMVFHLTKSGAFLDFKGNIADLYIPFEEIVGRNIRDLSLPPEVLDKSLEHIQRALETKQMQTFDYQLSIAERGLQDYEARLIASGDEQVIVIIRNVTERKANEARQKMLMEDLEKKSQKEREQRVFAENLHNTMAALNSTLDLQEILKLILDNIGQIIPHTSSNIMLICNGVAQVVQHKGWHPEKENVMQNIRFPVQQIAHMNFMYHTHQSCIINDVASYEDWERVSGGYEPLSYMAAPICVDNEVIGFLNLDCSVRDRFTPVHAQRLDAFVHQAAIALKNAQLYRRSQELAALEERQRLARDLHDSVTQTLFAASVTANAIIKQWQQGSKNIGDDLLEVRNLTQGALAEMRTLLLELRPDALTETDLKDLIKHLAETVKGRARLQVECETVGHYVLPTAVHVAFFRIAQEALNNVIKHARAKHLYISLSGDNCHVQMLVQDDGRGFDVCKTQQGHFGIEIMKERADEAGIELQIMSASGEGTLIKTLWQMKDEQ